MNGGSLRRLEPVAYMALLSCPREVVTRTPMRLVDGRFSSGGWPGVTALASLGAWEQIVVELSGSLKLPRLWGRCLSRRGPLLGGETHGTPSSDLAEV